jgi:molecular chaperone GrpE
VNKKLSKREQTMLDKIDELTQDVQRIQADFVNFRRRSEEESSQLVASGKRSVVQSLLPTLDSLQRALQHVPKDLEGHKYVAGIEGVVKQLGDALSNLGIKKVEVLGKEFDPELMEAVQVEDGDGETEIVIEELQAGYSLNGEIVRHAIVKVARK